MEVARDQVAIQRAAIERRLVAHRARLAAIVPGESDLELEVQLRVQLAQADESRRQLGRHPVAAPRWWEAWLVRLWRWATADRFPR